MWTYSCFSDSIVEYFPIYEESNKIASPCVVVRCTMWCRRDSKQKYCISLIKIWWYEWRRIESKIRFRIIGIGARRTCSECTHCVTLLCCILAMQQKRSIRCKTFFFFSFALHAAVSLWIRIRNWISTNEVVCQTATLSIPCLQSQFKQMNEVLEIAQFAFQCWLARSFQLSCEDNSSLNFLRLIYSGKMYILEDTNFVCSLTWMTLAEICYRKKCSKTTYA